MDRVKSKIIPLDRSDVDTDVIIPAEYLTTTSTEGLGEHVFARLREMEPDLSFNKEEYKGARILVTGKNFGCGSSREHAVWALADWGIQVVIAPSFADIFYSNALKNQVLPVVMKEEVVDRLLEGGEVEVVLSEQAVKLPDGEVVSFEIDPYRKECLLKDLSDLDFLLDHLSDIQAFDEKHAAEIFFDTQKIRNMV